MIGNLTHTRPQSDRKEYHLIEVQGLSILLVSTCKIDSFNANLHFSYKKYSLTSITLPLSIYYLNHAAKTDGDMENKKSAASMVVEVGSFSDSAAMPGLAHYLEHMLFMVNYDQ